MVLGGSVRILDQYGACPSDNCLVTGRGTDSFMVATGPSVVTGAKDINRDPSQLHQDHRISHGLWQYPRPRSHHGYLWQAKHLPQ